jgi:AraC family cel operon transcriptional repressor
MKLLWENEVGKDADHYYVLKRQTPTIRPFLPPHTHDYAEMIYLERGGCTHFCNGEETRIGKGDVLFIYPETVEHCYRDCDNNLSLLQILFPRNSFSFIITRYAASVSDLLGEAIDNPLCTLAPLQQIWFEHNFNRLLVAEESLIEIERFLLNFIGMITQHGEAPSSGAWLEQAIREIREPENFRRGARGFIDLCGRSGEHVEREVKRRTGHTITQVVNQSRMSWASYMLIFTDVEIIDISAGCGIQSAGHFYKLFREHYGVSPAKYRKTMGKTSTSLFGDDRLLFQERFFY